MKIKFDRFLVGLIVMKKERKNTMNDKEEMLLGKSLDELIKM